MSNQRSIDVIGDFVIALGAATPLAVPAGHVSVDSAASNVQIACAGAVQRGVAGDGTHWLALADLVEGDLAAGCAAWSSATAPQARWRGRFVQVLWRPGESRLIALTDHFSTLPLYTLVAGDALYLASDLRLLTALPAASRAIDPVAVYHYLNFGCIPAPRTICTDIQRIEPGTRYEFDRGHVGRRRYFLPDYPEDLSGSEDELAGQLRERIVASVEDYRPDPVNAWGCFLSGGTDSSSIVSILARQEPKRRVRSFSIGFAEAGYDELAFARLAAEACGAEPYFITVGRAQTTSLAQRIVANYDQPFGNASAVPTLACGDLAHGQQVNLLLAGDGGDEVFGGNQRYAKDQVMEQFYRLPSPLKALGRSIGGLAGRSPMHFLNRVDNFFERASLPNPDRFYTDDSFASDYYEQLLTPAFREQVGRDASLEFMREVYAQGGKADPLHRIMRLDLAMAIAQNDLVKVHGACKANGISVRFPYLDPALVAYTGRLPANQKVRRLSKRHLFKRAMADVLPASIIKKKKQGFGLPIAVWMRKDESFLAMVRSVLFDQRTRERGWFEPDFVERLLAEHIRGSWDHSNQIWQLLVLELWLRSHLDAK